MGEVTSSAHSVKLDVPIGLAFIRKAFTEEGTKLTAKSSNGRTIGITVCDLPFVK